MHCFSTLDSELFGFTLYRGTNHKDKLRTGELMPGMHYLSFSLFVYLSLAFLSLLDILRIFLLLLFLKCSLSIKSREKDSQTDSPFSDLRPLPH